jgi:CDGSH-type Zn-finger protein
MPQREFRQMAEAIVAQKSPYPIAVEAGKSYYWCSCGKSASQPFCDGSHKGSEFAPIQFKADASKTVYFCGCKATANAPLCDGRHAKL